MYGPCFSSIVGDHPLRSPTRHRLGKPLPYQLADGSQAPPKVPFGFPTSSSIPCCTCGISRPFGLLSPALGQVTNALLTRSPLRVLLLPVRLACIRHAASVHPEPGSNSPQYLFASFKAYILTNVRFHSQLKVLVQAFSFSCCFLSLFSC